MNLVEELLVVIARHGDWLESGPLARSSHSLMLCFTTPAILIEIVASIKRADRPLLRWLCFALPAQFCTNALFPPPPILPTIVSDDVFMSGSYVCRALYCAEWAPADVDVYTACLPPLVSAKNPFLYPDIHYTGDSPPQRVIENFDLSIVQQGFLTDGSCWVTPLSLYTRAMRDMIAMPHGENMQYDFDVAQRGDPVMICATRDIWFYLERNVYAPPCDCTFIAPHPKYAHSWRPLNEWCERVKKYTTRFPAFTLAYCKPPGYKPVYEDRVI